MTWRESPRRSERGTRTGIVNTAWPLTLGTGTWIAMWAPIIPSAEMATGRSAIGVNIP